MTTTENSDDDLSSLCSQVRAGTGTIVMIALIFVAAAIAWTSIRGPVYEATAYAQVDAPADIATIEQKLRFPSLYEKVTGSGEAARDLAQRSRVKTLRNSRLIAVTVRAAEPAQAAEFADAIIEKFIGADTEQGTAAALRARIKVINELSDDNRMTSPAVLLEALRIHKNSIEKSSTEDAAAAKELALKKLQLIESRVVEYLKTRRPQLGLPALEPSGDFDPEIALETTIAELGELYARRGELDARARALEAKVGVDEPSAAVRLVEPATQPTQPSAPGALIICLGAFVLGGFSGVLLVLLRAA